MEKTNKEPFFEDNSFNKNDELTDSLEMLEKDYIFQENHESATNESPKQKKSFLDSIMLKSKESITRLLNYLRQDNRSLITGLLLTCAISCFVTASIAFITESPKVAVDDVFPSYQDYSYDDRNSFAYSEVNPFNNYSDLYHFGSNGISDSQSIISQLEQFFEKLFGENWNYSSDSANQIDFPSHLFPNNDLEEF